MMCWPKANIGLISSQFMIGWCFTLLFIPRMGDVWGRKQMVAYCNFVSVVLYWLTLNSPNVYVLGTVLFTWGLFNSCRTNIGYLYMIELMPKKDQGTVGTVWNCIEGSINLFATLWFMNVTTHWFGFVSIGIFF